MGFIQMNEPRALSHAVSNFSHFETISRPEVIFFLGDIYDEGKWCDEYEFYRYRQRFSSLFATQEDQSVVVVAGNHDVGFHYAMNPYLVDR